MKKSEETLEDFAISYPLDKLAPLEQILFLDIETTGFTSRTSYDWLCLLSGRQMADHPVDGG